MFGSKDESSFFVMNRYTQSLDMSIEMDEDNIAESLQTMAIKHFQKYAFHSLYCDLSARLCDIL